MGLIDFITTIHRSTPRDYIGRVTDANKAECAKIAKRFGREYWDGDRQYGYGGYSYDGRWRPVAEKMAIHYNMKSGDRVLDVGCGKGYLLYELTQVIPGLDVIVIDISEYGIFNSKPEIRHRLQVANALNLPFEDGAFDVAISLATFHNFYVFDAIAALQEMQRVCRTKKKYVMVESYRNESEKANLLYWQLTCESFFTPDEWYWCFTQAGYQGDYGYIYFE